MKKLLSAMVAHIAFLPIFGAVYDVGMLQLPATTNITVGAGDTLRIEYLRGGTTLYKSGEGRLEVAVVANTNLAVVVSNGTFAAVKPGVLDASGDEYVLFHLDANAAGKLETTAEGGTNFVTAVADADGRSDRKLSAYSGRPNPVLLADGINGLAAIDLGSLHNAAADGYGAALKFDVPVTGAYEMIYVFEDDSDAKYRAKSIGPCPYGSPGTTEHVRGYVENGTNAPIHYTKNMSGRAQDGNYIDGVRYGTTGSLYYMKPVPDGPHVMRNKINKTTSSAFKEVEGLGYSSNDTLLSYGGLKIGEVIFLSTTSDYNTLGAVAEVYHTYFMRKWLDVATLGQVMLLGDATLDTSAVPLKCQLQWPSLSATVTDVKNLLPQGYYEAGNPAFAVESAEYNVPLNQTVVPGLSFAGNAVISTDSSSAVARVDGTGTFTKKGTGNLLLGVHDTRLNSLEVRSGGLRISPLESSGSWMHVDASASGTMTFNEVNGTNFVTKWLDVEHGGTYLAKTTTKYQFAADRSVGTPYISDRTLNGMPLIDFGDYTSEVYPNGNGGAFAPSVLLSNTANAPGMRNFFVIWGDYDEIADLPLCEGKELRGPGILAGDDGWGYRGFGGGGNTCPIFSNPPSKGTYHTSANSFLSIDGESFDYTSSTYTSRPAKGMHLLDQQVGSNGARLHYVGGCRWQAGYYGGEGSGAHPGTWGGVRMGEILIYRNLLPAYFRSRIAAVLGTKWFNRTNTLSYASVAVAPGASLAIPDTWVETQSLSLGGAFTAEEVAAGALELTGDAVVEGRIVVADGATVSMSCGDDGKLPSLKADEFIAEGEFTVAIAMTPDQISGCVGRSFSLIEGVSADLLPEKVRVKLPTAVRKRGVAAELSVADGVLAVDIDFAGLSVIVR